MNINITPPPTISQLSIIIKSKELYKIIYQLRFSIDKKHRFGIHTTLEETTLSFLTLLIESALTKDKKNSLQKARIALETIRHLLRLEHELQVINAQKYLDIVPVIEEISKMATGWYKSLP
jgi:DNA polymerase III alpha subunit